MANLLKNARIELRVTSEQKETIEVAAAIEGQSVTEFSASLLAERAAEVIERDRQLRVSDAQLDEFLAMLDRPARTVEGLRELMSRKSVFVD